MPDLTDSDITYVALAAPGHRDGGRYPWSSWPLMTLDLADTLSHHPLDKIETALGEARARRGVRAMITF